MSKLTKAQRALIIELGFIPNALRNGDEYVPKWWVEGKATKVRANVAESLCRRGWVKFTGKWGGQPGVLGFTVTPTGRATLQQQEPDRE